MLEKKAKENKSWKLRACKAENKLKIISSILTPSQIEQLQRQNVDLQCEESSDTRSNASDDLSLASCPSVRKPRDSKSHSSCIAGHKEVSEETVTDLHCNNQ